MDRRSKLFADLDLGTSSGLEIGPLFSPLVPKSLSNVLYVDHLSAEELREKYRSDPNVDGGAIVPVDIVWTGESLASIACPDGKLFDYVVASHVLEHAPDFVGWLRQLASVLKLTGRLGLILPDRRYTFDYLRRESTLADMMEAAIRGNKRPSPGQIFDFTAQAVEVDKRVAWQPGFPHKPLRRFCSAEIALAESRRGLEQYVDVHCWVFTPSSFLRLMSELTSLALVPFACRDFHTTEPNDEEFITVLERIADDETAIRQASSGWANRAAALIEL